MEIVKKNASSLVLLLVLFVTVIISIKSKKDDSVKIERSLKEIRSLDLLLSSRNLEISSLESKIAEMSSKSVSTKKVYFKTGQIKLEENSSEEVSQKIQESIKRHEQLTESYKKEISNLNKLLEESQKNKNYDFSIGAIAVYDSYRKLEAELIAKYKNYCAIAGKGISDNSAWRVGAGFCIDL